MGQRFIGRRGLSVSVIDLGAMTFGGTERPAARRMVDIAIKRGVTLYDTSDNDSSSPIHGIGELLQVFVFKHFRTENRFPLFLKML